MTSQPSDAVTAGSVPSIATDVPVTSASRIVHLDALRALAVMLVVVMHAGFTIAPGDGGVIIFFTVSGYIITSLVIKERERTGGFAVGSFYVRRLLKLAPPLVVLVVVPSLVYALFKPLSLSALAAQVGFVYNWVTISAYDTSREVLPGTEVVWSLAIEEQFYIGFALLWLALCRVRRWRGVLTVTTALVVVYSVATRIWLSVGQPAVLDDWPEQRLQHLYRGTDSRIEAIAVGVLVALAYDAYRRGSLRWLARVGSDVVPFVAVLAFASASLMRDGMAESVLRPTVQTWVAAMLIVYGLVPSETAVKRTFYRVAGWRLVQAIGLASYSIYLAHDPVMQLLLTGRGALPDPVLFVLLVVAGTAAGLAAYRVVEVPALHLKKRLTRS